MALRVFLDRVIERQKTLTTFGPESYSELEPLLSQFNVTLEHSHLPIPEADGYLTVRDDDDYLGSISAAAFAELTDPREGDPWDPELRQSAYRDLLHLLDDTTFTTTDKRQLVATSREIEDRAYRVGHDTLYASFQSLSTFETQLPIYEHLAANTDLSICVYGNPDWEPPDIPGVTVHAENDEIGKFWLVAFDGGNEPEMECALLAEERDPGEFHGFWTYDPQTVDELTYYLDTTYGDG
jgi:hypothetical protein